MAKKLFYSMGEVSEMFDVNPSLIRHWESKFEVLKPQKNKKGNRMFTPEDVENLKLIYHLVKERGMTLDGARRALKGGGMPGVARDMELLERLQSIRAQLVEVRNELKGECRTGDRSRFRRARSGTGAGCAGGRGSRGTVAGPAARTPQEGGART